MDIQNHLLEFPGTSLSVFLQPHFKYSNLTYSSVTDKPKNPNFLFWRCCPQEHLAAFPYAHMKNKYWNAKMKRIQNFKLMALRTKLKIYANIYPHF